MKRIHIVVLLLLALVALPVDGAEERTPWPALYVRDLANPHSVLGQVRNLAIRRQADRILLVFDTVTFAPPPGWTEFNDSHRFRDDLDAWFEAVRDFKAPDIPGPYGGKTVLSVATTLSGEPIPVADAGWKGRLEATLDLKWWDRADLRRFEAAPAWISRLLGALGGNRRMLVLVTGDILPEHWADYSTRSGKAEMWRKKLREIGEYWNEEAVAHAAARFGATLDVVAPEARFGDFLPLSDIPELPWASRPKLDPSQFGPVVGAAPPGGPAPPLGPGAPPTLEEMIRQIRKQLPQLSEEEVRELARRALDQLRKLLTVPADELLEPGARFLSSTPIWFPHYGCFTFFNTDCPSRLGYWPFARAAAATGGSYLFYPFPEVNFLDVCPYDRQLLRELAPTYGPRREFVGKRAGDPALDALCRAARTVLDGTPWSDGLSWFGRRRPASAWLPFDGTSPVRLTKRYRERNKPFDWPMEGMARFNDWKRWGAEIAEVLPDYDAAIAILDEAEGPAGAAGACRRSMANLRLARFWFEMSAFHLHALSLYLTELEKHVPKEVLEGDAPLYITYLPAIRMSDCLVGYEGRSVSIEEDRRWQSDPAPGSPIARGQGNLLDLPRNHPLYRALRHPGEVMKRLDPRLKSRALRMIDAGARVMSHEGDSPWGWMVYYSDAYTFICEPVPPSMGPGERPGVGPDPDGPPTPRPKPRGKGPGSGS